MNRPQFLQLGVAIAFALLSAPCEAQDLILGLKVAQPKQEALQALRERGVDYRESPDGKVARFRIKCESISASLTTHFEEGRVDRLFLTTGTVSPTSPEFLTLVPLIEECHKYLSSLARNLYGNPIAGGAIDPGFGEADECFERRGTLVHLTRYTIQSPGRYGYEVRDAIGTMQGKVARVSVEWKRLSRVILDLGISPGCFAEVNRRAASR